MIVYMVTDGAGEIFFESTSFKECQAILKEIEEDMGEKSGCIIMAVEIPV